MKKIFYILLMVQVYMLDWVLTPSGNIENKITRQDVTLVCFEDTDNNIESSNDIEDIRSNHEEENKSTEENFKSNE